MKKLALILAASLSVSAQADEIQDLINSANSIENSLQTAYRGISGVSYYAGVGGIPQSDVLAAAKLTASQVDSYNSALAAVSSVSYYSAEQFYEEQHTAAMEDLSTAVDAFSVAAQEISKVIEVADVAESATTVETKEGLQNYIAENDVELTQADITAYNQSLDEITNTAQQAAAFKAAANDQSVTEIADNAAANYNQSLASATASFDAANDKMLVAFASGQTLTYYAFFGDEFKSNVDVMGMGQTIYEDQGWN